MGRSKLCTICTAICSFFGSLATFILCTSSRISSSLRCTCHSTPCDSSCIPIVSTISSDVPTSTTFSPSSNSLRFSSIPSSPFGLSSASISTTSQPSWYALSFNSYA